MCSRTGRASVFGLQCAFLGGGHTTQPKADSFSSVAVEGTGVVVCLVCALPLRGDSFLYYPNFESSWPR